MDVMRRNGFSLVELMIAIGIIGILSTIAAVSWNRYVTNTNLRTAAREIEADLFSIKERAIGERIYYRLTLNVLANNYTIDKGTVSGAPYTVIQTKNPVTFGSDIYISSDTTFTGGQIIFQPRGTLGTTTGSIVLKNGRSSKATITINITGRTHVRFETQ
jgi:prepilin-type N-terminal cleavage/methylation domain-containing protein